MTKRILITLTALLLSGSSFAQAGAGTRTGDTYDTNSGQRGSAQGESREYQQREQSPTEKSRYQKDNYDSRYGEGAKRDKQAREKTWNKRDTQNNKDRKGSMDY